MRHLLAGALALVALTACGSTTAAPPGAADAGTGGADGTGTAATTYCASPEGYRVAHPAGWAVNPGDVLPACSRFAAAPFTVPAGSDIRTADVALSVRTGVDVSVRWPDETARRTVEVGGRPAVRIEQVTGPGFYPGGTPITTYVVDLGPAGDGEEMLVADAVGLPGFDHDRNVEVLDAMMASLTVDAAGRV